MPVEVDELEFLFRAFDEKGLFRAHGEGAEAVGPNVDWAVFAEVLDFEGMVGCEDDGSVGDGVGANGGDDKGVEGGAENGSSSGEGIGG